MTVKCFAVGAASLVLIAACAGTGARPDEQEPVATSPIAISADASICAPIGLQCYVCKLSCANDAEPNYPNTYGTDLTFGSTNPPPPCARLTANFNVGCITANGSVDVASSTVVGSYPYTVNLTGFLLTNGAIPTTPSEQQTIVSTMNQAANNWCQGAGYYAGKIGEGFSDATVYCATR